MRRIGIMGGTFNPIHYAHLVLAEQAFQQFSLDGVIFIPSRHPPHKDNSSIVSDEHRLNMLKLAIGDKPHFSISDIELKRDGLTYTSDTLMELNIRNKDTKYYFIMGGDSLESFSTWHEPDVILHNAVIIAAIRNDMSAEELHRRIKKLIADYSTVGFTPDIRPLLIKGMDISSKAIRYDMAVNKSVEYMLPDRVLDYIYKNKLYADDLLYTIDAYLKQNLSEHRYLHTIGVAKTSAVLAENYGYDVRKAYLAGLLHDIAKTRSVEELLPDAEKNNISLNDFEKRNPDFLVHAKLGAYYARTMFGIEEEEVLSAIKWHTTGRPDMTMLEKIIFIADYIEPGRGMDTCPSLDIIRSTAYTDINKAVYYELHNTIRYLTVKKCDIDIITLAAYEAYKSYG